MKKWQKVFVFFGRIFISLIFIISAINKIFDWQESEHALTNFLLDWQGYASFSVTLQNIFNFLMEWIPACLAFLIALQLIGGLLLFLGLKVRLGAFLIVFFLILSTLLFHPFWFLVGIKKQVEFNIFLNDLSIIGGLLFVLAFGSKGDSKGKTKSCGEPNIGGSGSGFSGSDSLNIKS